MPGSLPPTAGDPVPSIWNSGASMRLVTGVTEAAQWVHVSPGPLAALPGGCHCLYVTVSSKQFGESFGVPQWEAAEPGLELGWSDAQSTAEGLTEVPPTWAQHPRGHVQSPRGNPFENPHCRWPGFPEELASQHSHMPPTTLGPLDRA